MSMYTIKKSLGQHFLKDENIIIKIINALNQHSFENLLEVGPGGGALTKHLINIPAINFKAVELDTEKVGFLYKTFPLLKEKLLNKNFLEIEQPFDEPL